jgi:hypothetical protein
VPDLATRPPATQDTTTPLEIAAALHVGDATVYRWLDRLGYPPIGSGHRRVLPRTDLLICRAFQVFHGRFQSGHNPLQDALCQQATGALRRRPGRWLIVTPRCGFTQDTAEDAARLAIRLGLSNWWLIDLWTRT